MIQLKRIELKHREKQLFACATVEAKGVCCSLYSNGCVFPTVNVEEAKIQLAEIVIVLFECGVSDYDIDKHISQCIKNDFKRFFKEGSYESWLQPQKAIQDQRKTSVK